MVESSRLIVESQVKSSQEGVESRVESSLFSSSSSRVEVESSKSSRVESSRVITTLFNALLFFDFTII